MIDELPEYIDPSGNQGIVRCTVLTICACPSRNDVTDGPGVRSVHQSVSSSGSEIEGGQGQFGDSRDDIKMRMFQIVTGTTDRAELSEQADLRVSHSPILSD